MKKYFGELTLSGVSIGKILYGGLFVLILPALLVFWAWWLDKRMIWPVPQNFWLNLSLGLPGLTLIFAGMLAILVWGEGLPMNAYPPRKFVKTGVYALLPHPIYLGAVLLSAALSLLFQSGSGLYLITPLVALMLAALVLGYERGLMERRFGAALEGHYPLFSQPACDEKPTNWLKKIAMLVRLYLPLLLVVYFIDYARGYGLSFVFWAEKEWPAFLWMLPFFYMLLRLGLARTAAQLRQNVIAGSLMTGLFVYCYLLLPSLGVTMRHYGHLVILSTLSASIAVSYPLLWTGLRWLCEKVANSRHDYLFADGRFRIINHSVYAGLGGAVGVGIVSYMIGNAPVALFLLLCGIVGAAVFAQVWWGSSSLLRPFGYWGAVLGAIVGVFLVHLLTDVPLDALTAAVVLAAPFVQAIGRFRCLVQGCCHGIVTQPHRGIRVWQPQSRVCALSGLKGEWIHITQLYSITFNLLLGPVLWAMWAERMPNAMIVACYLILTGTERFAEDAYRGETQTRTVQGLKESQWVALIGLLVGFVISLLPSGCATSASGQFDLMFFIVVGVSGFITAFAMGMDFPKSTWRFARLSG